MSNDDPVGYRKPPKKHRYPKGVSGNLKGRPPKTKNIASLIDRELDEVITVREGDRELRLRKREAIVKRLVSAALRGDTRSIEYLVNYCKQNGAPDPFTINSEDEKAYQAALCREARKAPSAES